MNCCKDCKERILGCHDECEAYKSYRDAMDEVAATKRNIDDKKYRSAACTRASKRKMYGGHRRTSGGLERS